MKIFDLEEWNEILSEDNSEAWITLAAGPQTEVNQDGADRSLVKKTILAPCHALQKIRQKAQSRSGRSRGS
jgi:hypothetical protein